MRRLMALIAVALLAALVGLLPGPTAADAAPPLQAAGTGCNQYSDGVCVVHAGDSEGGTDTWYCNPSFGWASTNHCTTTINVGDTVRWENVGTIPHTATECALPQGAADQQGECNFVPQPQSPLFGAGILNVGDTLPFTFTSPGTWYYYCYVHPLQPYGIIRVVAAQPAPTNTRVPATNTPAATKTPGPTATQALSPTSGPTETPATGATPEAGATGIALGAPAEASPAAVATLPQSGDHDTGSGFPWVVVVAGGLSAVGAVLLGHRLLRVARQRARR